MKKNKLKIIASIAFIGVLALTGCAKREIKNVGSKGKNIICFGDSITFGYGVNPGQDYPSGLKKLISMPVINAGVDGDTSAQGLARIKKDVLDRDPYIVLVEFAGNDFIKEMPVDTTIANIKEIVHQIQAQGAIVAIVDISAGFFLRDYRLRLSKLAEETGAIFIPEVLRGILTNPSMKSDFMHPNTTGYKIIAYRIQRAILPYLK